MPTITMFYSKVGVFSPAFCLLNPLSTDGDQHQCSPCIFNALSKKRGYIYTRIKNIITQDRFYRH